MEKNQDKLQKDNKNDVYIYGLYDPKNQNFYDHLFFNSNFLGNARKFSKFSTSSLTPFKSKEKALKKKEYLIKKIKEVRQKNIKRQKEKDFISQKEINDYKKKTKKLLERYKRLKPAIPVLRNGYYQKKY